MMKPIVLIITRASITRPCSSNHGTKKTSLTWIAKVLPDETKVVLKPWDAWRFDSDVRNKEAAVYEHLRSLWGIYIPFLRISTPMEYFHALLLQLVKVSTSMCVVLTIRVFLFRRPI